MGQQDVELVAALSDLPAGGVDAVHDAVEDERLDSARLSVGCGEGERFLLAALDVADQDVGRPHGQLWSITSRRLSLIS